MIHSRLFPLFSWIILVTACSVLIAQSPENSNSQEPRFFQTLKSLELTPTQVKEIQAVMRKYRGNYRAEEFRQDIQEILTAAQVEKLQSLIGGAKTQNNSAEMQIDKNVVYAKRANTNSRFLSLDIYRPKQETDKLPVMIMIHGGGWSIGDKGGHTVGIDKGTFFTQQGFVYISINHRLTPAVQHPGHIIDVAEAIAWVHDHIEEYGGDSDRLFVMGHSAGAHLAALVATDESRLKKHDKPLSVIKGVVLLDGAGYDIPAKLKIGNAIASAMYQKAFTKDVEVQRDASPISHVGPDQQIPPFLIMPIASRTDSRQMSSLLEEALKNAKVNARIHVAQGKTHSSLNSDIGKAKDRPTEEMLTFLQAILAP